MTWLSQCVRVRVLSKGVSFEHRWYQFDVGIYPRKLAEVGIVGIFWCLRWHSPRVKCFVFFLSLLFVALYKDSSNAAAIASASCSSGCWHRWHLFALVASPRLNCVVLYSRQLWGGCGLDLQTSQQT